MRPLPRLFAITDARVAALDDLGVRAAAIAAAGPSVALVARQPEAGGAALTALTRRLLALARPPEAAVIVHGHPEIARGLHAAGIQLRSRDLAPADARRVFLQGWIGASVHSPEETGQAVQEGADFVVVGAIYPTTTHPEAAPGGPELVSRCAAHGIPVIAIGGITPARAREVRDAGAWGVAAISALWDADDPGSAALDLLAPWVEAA